MTFVSLTLPPIVCLFCMLMTPLSINLFPNHPVCPASKLTPIPSTTGSAEISLLLMLPKPNPLLFQPRRTSSLTWFCTSTISLFSEFLQPNSLGYRSLRTFPGISRLIIWARKLAERLGSFTGFSTVPRSVPVVFSIWLWYDPSWNMGAPPATLSIKPLSTALNYVKGLPAGLSFSLGKHLMKILFSSLTFLYCPSVMTSPPLSSIQNCPWFVFIFKSIQASSPTKFPELQLLCPASPCLSSDLIPEIILSIWPYALELPPRGNCPQCKSLSSFETAIHSHLARWLFIPILCNHCLPHLVLFGHV